MKKIRNLCCVLLTGILLFSTFALTGCGGGTTIDLDKYISFSSNGYDGSGTVSVNFDKDKFIEDYKGRIKLTKEGEKEYAGYIEGGWFDEEYLAEPLLDDCVDWNVEPNSNLCNGETVTLEWDNEDALAKEIYGVTFKCSELSYVVEGLEEVQTIDPFESLNLTYTGIAPEGEVSLDGKNDNCSYSVDKNNGLSNGDTVVVSATLSGTNSGFVLSETEKEYVVEGLPEKITDIADYPEDVYNKMDAQLQDDIKAEYAREYNTVSAEVKDIELLGTYSLIPKTTTDEPLTFFVYKITFTSNVPGEGTYYWVARFTSDLIKISDNEYNMDYTQYTTKDNGTISVKIQKSEKNPWSWSPDGFDDMNTLFNKIITSRIDRYTYTTTIEE